MDFPLPELGEGVYEAEMVRWLVKPGDTVKPGQPLLEALTDKATMEVPAPFAGVIRKLLVEPGQKLVIGQAMLTYDGSSSQTSVVSSQDSAGKPNPQACGASLRDNHDQSAVKAAPTVRLLARKLGIDLTQVHGSGPAGRILIGDVAERVSTSVPVNEPPGAKTLAPDYGKPGTRVKFQGLRRKIAEHMVLAKKTIPHFTYVDECDVTDLVQLRESLKEPFARKGVRITYLAFFVKAVAAALQEVPIVNATLNDDASEITLHATYHIGIAVAVPNGLIVPVVRDADTKSLADIARDIERLSDDARAGKSNLDDLRGGTFTITSIGNLGGLFSTPIIHHPQAGILGVGKIVKRPAFDEHGRIRAADLVYLSFAFDHRILDGAVGTAFGNTVMRQLQNPAALLIDP